jgi:hypothetical protein
MVRNKATDKGDTEAQGDEWDLPPATVVYPDDQDAPSAPSAAQEGTDEASEASLPKLRVQATTHVTLASGVVNPNQKLEVDDTAEVRNCIAVGFLRLLDDDEELDEQ